MTPPWWLWLLIASLYAYALRHWAVAAWYKLKLRRQRHQEPPARGQHIIDPARTLPSMPSPPPPPPPARNSSSTHGSAPGPNPPESRHRFRYMLGTKRCGCAYKLDASTGGEWECTYICDTHLQAAAREWGVPW